MKLPADLRLLLQRRFQSKHRDWLAEGDGSDSNSTGSGSTSAWPLVIYLGAPSEQDALRQIDAVRSWAGAWRAWSGAGELRWTERRWRVLGTQNLPDSLVLHGPSQVAAWIGEQERWRRAAARFQQVTARWPTLAQRVTRLYGVLADYDAADFERLLDLLAWLVGHPDSGLYPRQIPLAGIDSKWLETRTGIVTELVAVVRGLPANSADFFSVCGLRSKPALLRIRILDSALRARVGGLGDITAPVEELARLDLPAATVLIVENLQTGLALGDLPGTVAVLALGYGVDVLAQVPWVSTASKLYWGDIDTHGYAMLHLARASLGAVTSVLMDEATFLQFIQLCTDERSQCSALTLDTLTPQESQVYTALRQHRWGQALRLEQERIAWDHAWPTLLAAANVG